eukprot:1313163-Amphidinium_carterae.1
MLATRCKVAQSKLHTQWRSTGCYETRLHGDCPRGHAAAKVSWGGGPNSHNVACDGIKLKPVEKNMCMSAWDPDAVAHKALQAPEEHYGHDTDGQDCRSLCHL